MTDISRNRILTGVGIFSAAGAILERAAQRLVRHCFRHCLRQYLRRCLHYGTHRCVATLVLLCLSGLATARAQDAESPTAGGREGAPRVFLDCARCDASYIRREITFVNYVRERQLADVHVLITDQQTGSGGRAFTVTLVGQGRFAGRDYEITHIAQPSETEEAVRRGLVEAMEVGLVPYLLDTPLASRLSISFDEPEAAAAAVSDPWRGWVFEVYADGFLDAEASRTDFSTRYGIFADRVTEDWKIRFRPYFNYSFERFEGDDEIITSESRRDGLDSYAIRSLGDHWSAGLFADAFTSTYSNIDLRLAGGPGVEYSVFPYREAARRELTVTYLLRPSHVQYADTTIFGEIEEVLLSEAIDLNFELTQLWGSLDLSLEGSHYFHDLSKYRLEFDGGVSVRLSRGLSLRFGADLQLIHDQLNLARGDASLEELLLRQRQLATTYEVSASLGFRYQFGSLYNNVVNTRF